MRTLLIATLVAAAASCAHAQQPSFLDPVEQYKSAYNAAQRDDRETALQHYENLIDSCDIDPAMRLHVVDRVRGLRPMVRVDPAKEPSNTWSCLVLVYKNLDFEWTDESGTKHHVTTTMSDDDIAAVREGMDNFAKHVLRLTSRELKLDYTLKVVDRTVTDLVGETAFWFSPGEAANDMAGIDDAAYDTVFAFTKFQQDDDGPSIPGAFGGGSLGADAGAKGCGYINILLWAGSLKPGVRDGEIELHEWLHQVDWAFTAVQGYPDDICPTSDGGRVEGDFGGDPDFRRTPDMKNWMPFYEHIMRDHVTRRMWRNASMHRVPPSPWFKGYIREWLVIGPFEKVDGKTFDTSFINERSAAPQPGSKAGGLLWRTARAKGLVLDLDALFDPNENTVAYAHVYVHSDTAQRAQLRLGSDDGAAVWHNGALIYRATVPRALTIDVNVIDVMLGEGLNSFLFKVDEISGGWSLAARFTTPDGKALTGVRYVTDFPREVAPGYHIVPGDVLTITVGKDAESSETEVRVTEEGFINLPHIGKLKAVATTTRKLELKLADAYRAKAVFVDQPVRIEVTTLCYYVDGQVRIPGKRQYVGETTVYQAILDAGGFTPFADRARVLLLRQGTDDQLKITRVDCAAIENGQLPDDVTIIPGDVIRVPKNVW